MNPICKCGCSFAVHLDGYGACAGFSLARYLSTGKFFCPCRKAVYSKWKTELLRVAKEVLSAKELGRWPSKGWGTMKWGSESQNEGNQHDEDNRSDREN